MKTRIIVQLLFLVIINQSCVVYQIQSVSLNEAVDKGIGMVYSNGEELKFKNITLQDSVYYFEIGRERKKNISGEYEWVDTIITLDSAKVSVILLKDIKKSKKRTALLVVSSIPMGFVLGTVIFALVFAIAGNGW